MKAAFLIAAILVIQAHAQQFGDDNQNGNWLPIPDNFVWPVPLRDAPDFEPSVKAIKDLPKELQNGIEGYWPEDSPPKSVELFECDLNGDGKKEVFIAIPAYSGTGGTFYEILTPEGESYRGIGAIQGWGFLFHKVKNGWYQIEGMSRGGGGNYTRYLLSFDGKEYQIIRNEGHDFNRGEVEIRK
ncbi:hypothetical protein QQ054_21940 [Oscillatoria amoena NRMC-F 0135]|nr:hypothetical protein [Oscillatoria laete-virens]MDL5048678.1 hypothetical protein [Oscillatoria amoena NRMC-F 0135]MDL5053229.1 hypothetical protein [Oscillatoria laete-virens NRMC-F 0139]